MTIFDIVNIVINENENKKLNGQELNNIQVVNSILNNYVLINNCTIKYKFYFINQFLNNIFVEKETKNFFLECIQKIQKIYWVLNKFAFLYKYKKAKMIVKEDLYLNPIDLNAKNIICILQDNSKYLFILSDLVNIINMSLSNASYFFSEPLSCRNPYNNSPFNKSTLYNIYFKVMDYNYVIPELLHLFFLSNFNLSLFKENNEYFLRDYSINEYVKSKDTNILYKDIMVMLNTSIIGFGKRIRVDVDFPRKKLVDIMRPYLLLQLLSKYSLNPEKQFKSIHLLKKKLVRFYNYNSKFGRKKIDLINVYCSIRKKITIKKVIYFMDKHISFEEKEIDFMNNHCKVQDYLEVENNPNESDEMESSDSEESSEYVSEAEELREDVIPHYISSESDDNSNSVHITFHTDADSEYFNEIFEHSFRSHELENNEETKEDDSIS